jgi:hypothetical protein
MSALAAICLTISTMAPGELPKNSFAEDVDFLSKHVRTFVLSDASGKAKVAVVPGYQGRVMTSTDGASGLSYGWINRELIGSGKLNKHINAFGGEDRFWLGPEGGQFSIFFQNGDPFDLAHWQTPAPIDSDPYNLVKKTNGQAIFEKTFELENYMGYKLLVGVERTVRVLSGTDIARNLGVAVPKGVNAVAYETVNTVSNAGKAAWNEDVGMLSVWILGMYNAGPLTTVAIPYKTGEGLGPIVNDAYFGKVPADRLKAGGGMIYFKGDSKFRSKIGVAPRRAKPVMGSYDAKNRVLTLVQFTLPGNTTKYVNSMWEIQTNPFGGDVVNSYNDGPPPTGGKQLGAFYELESSSPALGLKPGQSATHVHRTIHLQGDMSALEAVSQKVLGVGVGKIAGALK